MGSAYLHIWMALLSMTQTLEGPVISALPDTLSVQWWSWSRRTTIHTVGKERTGGMAQSPAWHNDQSSGTEFLKTPYHCIGANSWLSHLLAPCSTLWKDLPYSLPLASPETLSFHTPSLYKLEKGIPLVAALLVCGFGNLAVPLC